jgi:hypothetical protein
VGRILEVLGDSEALVEVLLQEMEAGVDLVEVQEEVVDQVVSGKTIFARVKKN